MNIEKECLKLINKKGVLSIEEIYTILIYAKNGPLSDEIDHVYYILYGLSNKERERPEFAIDMITLIDEMNKHCDYEEAKEGFLTDLTIGCCANHVDADNGFIFYSADGFNYFQNEKQMTEIIKQWFRNGVLEEDNMHEVYAILLRGGN